MIPRVLTSRFVKAGWKTSLEASARLASTARRSVAYGRADSTAVWARRSFAAETISIVFVIWAVLRTLRIRRRMSRSVATYFFAAPFDFENRSL